MTIHTDIQLAFNNAHASYDNHCMLQKHIGTKLIQQMLSVQHKHPVPRIIDLGCGTGLVTQQLVDAMPFSELHAVDFAPNPLALARIRLNQPNIHVYEHNFDEKLAHHLPFDIAFANMSLHWSTNLENTLNALRTQLSRHSLLCLSIPLLGSLHELTPDFSINAFIPADAFINTLAESGFDLLVTRNETIKLHFQNGLSALKSFKLIGANATARASNHLHGKNALAALTKLTYHIGYFIARKTEHPCHKNYSSPAPILGQEKPISALDY